MGLPGTYIKVTSPKNSYIVPYSTEFGFQCQQIWFKPLEELFGYLKNLAGSMADSNNKVVSAIGSVAQDVDNITSGLKNIFGIRFLNMAFTAQAWKGEEPVNITLTLPFFMGMKDKWNAKEEVYTPIMAIMRETVPQVTENKLLISAPGPSAINVYHEYGKQIFEYIGDIASALTTFATSGSATAGGDNTTNTVETQRNTWSFDVGYSKDGSVINNKYIGLKNLIVRSSGFTFSTELDDNDAPISGKVTLSLSAQTIIVSTDFNTTLVEAPTTASAP